MLRELSIRDIVLVDRLTIPMAAGLTAVTGETGAGKSILLDAIGLAVGAKGKKGLVRHGAPEGVVVASFDVAPDHPVFSVLADSGLSACDDMLTLRRIQSADGRSRAFINDEPCSVALLRKVGACLIEIHGQHDSVSILDSVHHRDLLDAYGGHGALLEKVSAAWTQRCEAEAALAAHRKRLADAQREEDYLRHVLAELDTLALLEGEEAQLAERRAELMAAEKVAEDLETAIAVLEDEGQARRLASAAAQLERAAGRLSGEGAVPLTHAVERLDAALDEFRAAREATVQAAHHFSPDQSELEATEERLFALRAAGRKYGRAPEALPSYRRDVEAQVAELTSASAAEEELALAVAARRDAYEQAAGFLSKARRRASRQLEKAVTGELAPLKLDRATFEVAVDMADAPGQRGVDRVGFMLSANPGVPVAPLGDVASGGELSRIVLALKSVLAAAQQRTVIVFDEVDAGVGGAVANAVGECLSRISTGAQVLVVTHSPQVASRADTHLRVEKSGRRVVKTTLNRLGAQERVEEIARMLSGAVVTDAARQTAGSLLGAQTGKNLGSPKLVSGAKAAA